MKTLGFVSGLLLASFCVGASARPLIGPYRVTWQPVGYLNYMGYGGSRAEIDVRGFDAAFIDFRIPSQCQVSIQPSFVGGVMGRGVDADMQGIYRSSDAYGDVIYRLHYRYGAHLRRILVDLYSPVAYGPEARCTITVLASSGELVIPVAPEPTPGPTPVSPRPTPVEPEPTSPVPPRPVGPEPDPGTSPGTPGDIPPLPRP